LPPLIQSKSRMRQCARTDLCGGEAISDGRLYRDSYNAGHNSAECLITGNSRTQSVKVSSDFYMSPVWDTENRREFERKLI
jgi:hypothetical protein